MKKFVTVGIILLILGLVFLYQKNSTKNVATKIVSSPVPTSLTTSNNIDISATFKIVTNGTTRIFTNPKYHSLSDDVYITSKNPSKIEVRKENTTWSDFFKTLPMSLDKNCLVTGTKQTFCTNDIKKLYFYINNIETPNALDNLIKENDYLLVEYK